MTSYALTITIDTDHDDAVARTRTALADQGFGVLTEIDVAATMKTKLDIHMTPHLILGACNPTLAHAALTHEPSIGLLLPCNVVVRTLDDGRTLVEAMDPTVMVTTTGNPALTDVADQARTRLTAALHDLKSGIGSTD